MAQCVQHKPVFVVLFILIRNMQLAQNWKGLCDKIQGIIRYSSSISELTTNELSHAAWTNNCLDTNCTCVWQRSISASVTRLIYN